MYAENNICIVKHGVVSVILWELCSSAGTGKLVIDKMLDGAKYKSASKRNPVGG